MNDRNVMDAKSEIIEILRIELPVLRAKARISQEDIAEKIGISRQTYSSIETGKRTASWTTILALIAYFQNNEDTAQMIDEIAGLREKLEMVLRV